MDTMTATKVVGALCGSLLIFLLGGWVAEELYHVGGGHEEEQAYTIAVPESEAPAEETEEIPFEEVFASADPAEGEAIWRQCSSCHALEDGVNGTGPHLFGVVGREQAVVADYSYSSSFAELAAAWTPEELDGFLADPSGWVPGTKMTYRGLADVEDRANIIAYLETFGS